MSLIVDEHRQYLADEVRVGAFRRALTEVVKPGDIVLDLGAGTGVLGLFACGAGAARVYSIDGGGMIELARSICKANGFDDRVVFLKGFSKRLEIPEQVDVVVADQIGRFGFEAGILDYFDDARRRFLKPGGTLVPGRIDLWVAPVECPEMWSQVAFWDGAVAGFDFGACRTVAANTGYPVKYRSEHLLGPAVRGASLNLDRPVPEAFSIEETLVTSRAGDLHGIGGWFSAQLSPSVSMTNSPTSESSISRRNVYFPLEKVVRVDEGDRVVVRMQIVPQEVMVTWKVDVFGGMRAGGNGGDAPKARFSHSTFKGMLLAREDLQRTKPQFAPSLTPWGRARLTVLELCDGRRPLSDIEREVHERHADLFESRSHAAEFTAEVVTRYSR